MFSWVNRLGQVARFILVHSYADLFEGPTG
jgi:hypothetical protein